MPRIGQVQGRDCIRDPHDFPAYAYLIVQLHRPSPARDRHRGLND